MFDAPDPVATEIAVSMAFGHGTDEPQYSPRDFWIARPPGDRRAVTIGIRPEVAGVEWVRPRIT
ncbi:MAG: hypothetical protein WAN74_04860 [Thermoplasmata archaeon]